MNSTETLSVCSFSLMATSPAQGVYDGDGLTLILTFVQNSATLRNEFLPALSAYLNITVISIKK